MTPPQQSLSSGPLIPPSGPVSPQQQHQNQGMFHQANDFTVMGTFIEGNVIHNNVTSNQFMKEFLEKTIPGAQFDSSERDPPPRCHPTTRLAILDRCLSFIRNCDGKQKIRWVVGAAGVGKSAVMQSVVESPELPVSCHASVFFSINGRNDATKAIATISYQFAVKSEVYRQVIENEISRDPSLLQSSMEKQFNKLIVEPFIHEPQLDSAGRVLIIIDGLDECNHPRIQLNLLRHICNLCIKYPSSPLVWLIASRPETHITSFFARAEITPIYEKVDIPVDSDEGRADVEWFLRDEFTEMKKVIDSLDPQWPKEQDLRKLANASGGLFAYAQTVIRYIGYSTTGSPTLQFSDVLNVIDNHPMTDVPREDHPMASLDALYARILSNVPSRIMINTRKLLLVLASGWNSVLPQPRPLFTEANFIVLCNWLGMTADEAYAALNHLRSVLRVPGRDKAHKQILESFHKSFIDYVSDFTRSGFSPHIKREAQRLKNQCAFRILKEAPDGIDFFGAGYSMRYCTINPGPGTGDKIALSWPVVDGYIGWDNCKTRLNVYKLAIGEVITGIKRGDQTFQNEFCIRLLTTGLEVYDMGFPFRALCDLLFDESRRDGFMMHGILKQMPLKAVNTSIIFDVVKLHFRRPATGAVTNVPHPQNSSCDHEWDSEWQEGKDQDSKTTFVWELQFVNPEDGMSEWTYQFWCRRSPEEHRMYRSTV
ncbi:hypothetical protein AGABI1DRAFT_104346 [Agaricus bisporus var. burnettii JB137-S8]|uniref:Nephrocystin 3-like N-terminal domain-containing protein n=1 Tax=Agaricus bisporus var. burnettii (strain JB137-S8 / ATCC MYA-4627 / FGSC 10392) TaxID=597362 RepID=K5X392_AGABU|nr:uncharacterized protein AGABI1DRAFT_104346 [Agaricus bisporus var. burnettii JB137-S8]EKM82311.1 hypothetical protein AGABI1DRAFT_104346 [Agaricus bisporus var. burnettii JB137-S8]